MCFSQGGSDGGGLETDASFEGTEERPAAPVAGNLLRTLTGPEFSVAVGIGIILAVLVNRIATPDLVDTQARTDILGVIASGGLVTNGVYLLVGTGVICIPHRGRANLKAHRLRSSYKGLACFQDDL